MARAEKPHQRIFEEKAKSILDHLHSHVRYDESFLPRPFFIEVTGSPSAGKTTTITEFDKFFRRMGFRVLRPQEGAEVIRHIERTTPLYNIRTGLYALQILIDLSHGHQYDIVIFDRGIFDVYCWMMYWANKGQLSCGEKKLIQNFFLSHFWLDRIDIAYFMVCSVKEAMKRELRIALTNKLGETTNPATIKQLVDRYQVAYQTLCSQHPQLYLINTTRLKEQEMVEMLALQTLNILEQKSKQNRPAT